MPWQRATLRGTSVYVRVRADGAIDAPEGRAEVRYKLGDARAYFAAERNLAGPSGPLLPDDAMPPAVAVAPKDGADGSSAASKKPSVRGGRTTRAAAIEARSSAPTGKPAPGTWIAYTDGACSGNPGPTGAGVIVLDPAGKTREGYAYLGTATNNVGELVAVQRAILAIPKDAPGAIIHTDSQYAIGVLSKGWKAKANVELIGTIRAELRTRTNIALVYVPGHAGVALNERADELAREAIKMRRSHLTDLDA